MEKKHAVVLGGSMAGLLAARVLSERFAQVTILDRDSLPEGPENRRGVPQGRHTHGLLAGGRRILDQLFPGISRELTELGAIDSDIVQTSRWFIEGACHAKFSSGLAGLLLSRPLLESGVRRRTLALPNVRLLQGRVVNGLAATPDRKRVTGVRLGEETISADLVIDATGRASKGPDWLEALGYQPPPVEKVQVNIVYVTCLFRREPRHCDGDVAVIIPSTLHNRRGGVALAQENDVWTVTMIGQGGGRPPCDLPGFLAYARQLPAPYIYEAVKEAEPLSAPFEIRYPASTRRRYEKLRRFPEGYLAIGDSLSSFNPIYGQGMTVAAQEALLLGAALDAGEKGLAKRFFRSAAQAIDAPWSMAVGNDLKFPETEGSRTAAVRFVNWYLRNLHRAAHTDQKVALAFHRVANLVDAPSSVMRPSIAARVARANFRRRDPKSQTARRALSARA
jgi:2-polyprenyl-6-methoxyphenol hydroxylase-like FAD-dependent oxidoreductase